MSVANLAGVVERRSSASQNHYRDPFSAEVLYAIPQYVLYLPVKFSAEHDCGIACIYDNGHTVQLCGHDHHEPMFDQLVDLILVVKVICTVREG